MIDFPKVRHLLLPSNSDLYALGLSVASAIGFAFAVGGVTFIDSHYVNAVFGLRTYPLGYSVLIFCIPEAYLTYRLTTIKSSIIHVRDARLDLPVTRAIWALMVPVVLAFALSPNYLPEFPHIGLMEAALIAGCFSCTGIYVHNLRDRMGFRFVKNVKIDAKARIEILKLSHATWSDAFKLLVTVYLGVAGVYILYGSTINLQANRGDPIASHWWTIFGASLVMFYSCFLALAILPQLLGGMADIQEQLLHIRRPI